jgi:hypothetical protein
MREGSGNGAYLSIGALREEPGGRAPILRTLSGKQWKPLQKEHFFKRAA